MYVFAVLLFHPCDIYFFSREDSTHELLKTMVKRDFASKDANMIEKKQVHSIEIICSNSMPDLFLVT